MGVVRPPTRLLFVAARHLLVHTVPTWIYNNSKGFVRLKPSVHPWQFRDTFLENPAVDVRQDLLNSTGVSCYIQEKELTHRSVGIHDGELPILVGHGYGAQRVQLIKMVGNDCVVLSCSEW